MKAHEPAWKRCSLSHVRDTEHTLGIVFGCVRPRSLWAWVVFWDTGKASGVESTSNSARLQAEDCAKQVEGRWPK